MKEKFLENVTSGVTKCVLSEPIDKTSQIKKINITKWKDQYRITRNENKKDIHKNIPEDELRGYLSDILGNEFRSLVFWDDLKEYSIRITKSGRVLTRSSASAVGSTVQKTHNREKNYLIPEGTIVAPLVDMGVFTREGKIVSTMHDKYRQINRFLELFCDELDRFPKEKQLNIIDFGCGKSYLTFIVYYYLHEILGYNVHITGLDLKRDVIENCNAAAMRYGYTDLRFEVGDINGYTPSESPDIVVTLHACDTATDFALYNAVNWGAKLIMSVPCCQHEVCSNMEASEIKILERYGLIKERAAALFTDAIRANMLITKGYSTKVLEFVDMSHTPKNVLIRAVKTAIPEKTKKEARDEVEVLIRHLGCESTIYRLLK